MKNQSRLANKRIRICLVSDFFFPNFGGVETHVWCLAQCLMQRGHKVIVVTHRYGDRCGVRVMANGLKVYYLPLTVVYDQVVLPTMCCFLPLFRDILHRERIQIVHGHQCVSVMAHEGLLFARSLGYRTCFTDHSLFGFQDLASIHINKMLEITLSDVDHVICVSHACRENLSIRARLHPSFISAIPNAVDTTKFMPLSTVSTANDKKRVTVVVLSRLVFRKGIDLLAHVIPHVCAQSTNVHFVIGGDGPKLLLLEEMREKHQLYDRVEFLGAVPHSEVRNVLSRGNIFLNCSLTESFCIALLEAASCGLFVVSTKVGGVCEVLPPSMIKFADPHPESLAQAVLEGVNIFRKMDPSDLHECVSSMYSWTDVAKRVENIYLHVMTLKRPSLIKRIFRFSSSGRISGVIAVVVVIIMEILLFVLELLFPLADIEMVPENFPVL